MGAGTNANVFIILISESGIHSRAIKLDCHWRNDFEKGNIDKFKVGGISNLGAIGKISLWRDSSSLHDGWFVEWVKVRNVHSCGEESDSFPINRWVRRNRSMVITKYDCMLPQFDDYQEQRTLEIVEKRKSYVLIRKSPGMPKQVTQNLKLIKNL